MKGKGVEIKILKAEEFAGEYDRRSLAYIGLLRLAGLWAMMTNTSQAVFLKLFQGRNSPLKKILWELGRDPNHISSSFFDRFSQYNHLGSCWLAGVGLFLQLP